MGHRCPRPGCQVVVPDHLFACKPDWFALPQPTRTEIIVTARRRLIDRRRLDAVKAALAEWRQLDQRNREG